MLFPRTHYIQMQEEYFNVGLSFELFLRAFGELDVLHEEQVVDGNLAGYKILVLFDVKLLPAKVAEHIVSFVENGGIVIADCVPGLDAYEQPLTAMEDLFGVADATMDRIVRSGHWVPYKNMPPIWANRPADPPDESTFTTDTLRGEVFGQSLDVPLISPRPCTITNGETLLATVSGQPGVVHRNVGKGEVFLLGFCVQDTYFRTWQREDVPARGQLQALLHAITEASGVRPHVRSSNPDIEAAIRASAQEGFLFIINHEAPVPETTVQLDDLDFDVRSISDMETGEEVAFQRNEKTVLFNATAPLGEFRLLNVRP